MSIHGLGVVLDSFGQPVKDALRTAAKLELRQVELPATTQEVDPQQLGRSGRRHLMHYVSDLGLNLTALGGDLGGARFTDSSALDQRLEKTRRIIEMAAELRVPVVTTHLGRVDKETLGRGYLLEAVRYLAEISDRTGTFVAVETGSGDPQTLAELLRQVNSSTLGAAYDPASLLVEGYDPLSGIDPLADRIFIARVRDAIAGSERRPGREVNIGDGQVDLAEYLASLDQAGYNRAALIRRTSSDRPIQDIAEARERLRRLVGK